MLKVGTRLAGAVALASVSLVVPAAGQPQLASRTYSVSRCGAPSGTTYLTYDDANYVHPHAVVQLAAAAQRRRVGLGVFELSSVTRAYHAKTGASLSKQLRDKGMYVNNHTYDHPDLTKLSRARIDREIRRGVKGAYLRPPYGAYNNTVRRRAHALGYRLCTWTFDTNDWKGYSGSSICSNVVHNAPKGAVILMHLNHSAANPHTLGCIVRGLRHRGHHLCRPFTRTHPGRSTPVRLYKLPC